MVYSQNNEEQVITAHFETLGLTNGHFLDIGANDGILFSNTRRLYELGWSGACVEPCPLAFRKLMAAYTDEPRVSLYNMALTVDSPKISEFWDSGSASEGLVSTLEKAHRDIWAAEWVYSKYYIKPVSMSEFFAHAGTDFDFINIDVEGCNMPLFAALPFQQLTKLKMLCVEFEDAREMITKVAGCHGFRLVAANGENLIFVRP